MPGVFEWLIVAAAISGALCFAAGAIDRRNNIKIYKSAFPWLLASTVGIILLMAILFYPSTPKAWQIISAGATILGGVVVGIALWALKILRKDLYGICEIATSFIILGLLARTSLSLDLMAAALVFVGAVYVFVRGLTNFNEGLDER